MSNAKSYGQETVQTVRFLSVEHGLGAISITAFDGLQGVSVKIKMPPEEARKLVEDLLSRIADMEPGGVTR
jgi:hypothetical protein